jgi:hypothetical protein
MTGDEIIDGLAGAPIRHVFEPQPARLCKPLAQNVLVGANARSSVAQSWFVLGECDQLRDGGHPNRRMRCECLCLVRELDDWNEILAVVDAEFENVRRADDVVVGHQHRVAVGRAFDRRLDADRSTCAGPVLDHDLLAEQPRQILGRHPRHEIEPAARRQRHDEADGPGRPPAVGRRRLRAGLPNGADASERERAGACLEQGSAGNVIQFPSLVLLLGRELYRSSRSAPTAVSGGIVINRRNVLLSQTCAG